MAAAAPAKTKKVSVLLSALVERFFVSRMWDFFNVSSIGIIDRTQILPGIYMVSTFTIY